MRLGPPPSAVDDLPTLGTLYAQSHNFLIERIPFFRYRTELARRLRIPDEVKRRSILGDDGARAIYNAAAKRYLDTVPEWRDRYLAIVKEATPKIPLVPLFLTLAVDFPADMEWSPENSSLADAAEMAFTNLRRWFLRKIKTGPASERPANCYYEAFFNLVWDTHREVGSRCHDILVVTKPEAVPPAFPTSLSLLTSLHREVNLFVVGQGKIVDLFRSARAGQGPSMPILLEQREAISKEHPPTGNIVNHLDTPAFGKGPHGDAGSLDHITRLEARYGPWWVAEFEEQLLRDAKILRNRVEAAINRTDSPLDPWQGRLVLDLSTKMVQLDGEWEAIRDQAAMRLFRCFYEAGPGAKLLKGDLEKSKINRPDQARDKLPARLKRCVVTGKGPQGWGFVLPPAPK